MSLTMTTAQLFARIAKVLTGTPIQILRSRSIELNFDNLRHYIDNDHCNL